MDKIKLALIFGGDSTEHEVSRMSVTSILNNLPIDKYEPYIIGITKEGNWFLYNGDIAKIEDGSWEKDPAKIKAFISPDKDTRGIVVMNSGDTKIIEIDVVFPVLHGKNGEDGTIQGLLDLSGIPYVGCGTSASVLCMDKAITHTLLSAANIEQAHYLWFYADRFDKAADVIKSKIEARLDFPVFVKPANAGSSVGVSRVDNVDGLDEAVIKAAKEDSKIVVESSVKGQEIECAVMGNRNAKAAPLVGEIVTGADFYDYEDKYVNGTSKQVIPANIDDETAEEIRNTAVRAYRLLGCKGLSRVDFFVTEDKKVVLNEINTLPGFTSISMYAMLWQKSGMSYSEVLDSLISCAVENK